MQSEETAFNFIFKTSFESSYYIQLQTQTYRPKNDEEAENGTCKITTSKLVIRKFATKIPDGSIRYLLSLLCM